MMRSKNIKFCAFLKLHNINPVEVDKIAKGKAEYVYDIKSEEFERWQIKFNASEFLAYANHLEAIKDLAY